MAIKINHQLQEQIPHDATVFPGTIYQKYIHPIAGCDSLPFIVFRHDNSQCREVNRMII